MELMRILYPPARLGYTRIFNVPAAFISKAFKAAAVVSFRKALIKKLMEAAGTPVG